MSFIIVVLLKFLFSYHSPAIKKVYLSHTNINKVYLSAVDTAYQNDDEFHSEDVLEFRSLSKNDTNNSIVLVKKDYFTGFIICMITILSITSYFLKSMILFQYIFCFVCYLISFIVISQSDYTSGMAPFLTIFWPLIIAIFCRSLTASTLFNMRKDSRSLLLTMVIINIILLSSFILFQINTTYLILNTVSIIYLSILWIFPIFSTVMFFRSRKKQQFIISICWFGCAFFLSFWLLAELDSTENKTDFSIYFVLGCLFEMAVPILYLIEKIKLGESRSKLLRLKKKEVNTTRQLLRILCHDLSNSVSVIQSQAVIRSNIKKPSTIEQHLESWKKVEKSIDFQGDIITHVRTLEAIESGKQIVYLARIDLLDIFKQTIAIFEEKLNAKKLAIKLESHSEQISIMAEKISLMQNVISNVISNAIKFSTEKSEIKIWIEDKMIDYVNLYIKDRGIGIPKQMIDKIFDPSESTSRPGTSGEKGTGFGMPLVKTFMKAYGGDVSISSKAANVDPDDHGTTICLSFKKAKNFNS